MYRIIRKPHQRTKNKWCIYPMYDWTHGESDYIEQVSHSLCSLEFVAHRELYEWFVNQIYQETRIKPKQREFARLNLSYTVTSKRKLAQLVEEKIVNGWDDPRMPTLSGLRRRGYTPESIRKFCDMLGVAKRENLIEIALLEFCVREHLNAIAPRVMGVVNPLKLIIINYPKGEEEWLEAENNPEEAQKTFRKVPFSRELYIEKEDFREVANRKFFRLKLGGEVRLKNAYIIKAEKVIKDEQGEVVEIYCTYDPKSKSRSGTEESLRKVKGTIHWVSITHALEVEINNYDHLFQYPKPDTCEGGFTMALNPQSLLKSKAFVEPSLNGAKAGDKFQFQRTGYFCVDIDSTKDHLVFNKTVGLRDSWSKININQTLE
ncbi:glutamine--tRNA ligase [Elysia marginata]|uniref:Glutamine--tRNA ligase n=1 Tax=Elysia marginata TaxID=1093978 RepID=A0AAV4H222_9GAST|nr:glutamine--tRNA ligase [Elysia marginata]